ncbi:hypothetical protein [Desulfobacula sp.]
MDSMKLKDFRPDISNFNSGENFSHHKDLNTLKINKLSNRITIISIIIPCLVGAILAFAYLDMKGRVVDSNVTKQSQFDKISQLSEEKLNSLDVKIAKNKFALENTLPQLEKKTLSLEEQISKITRSTADSQTTKIQFKKLAKQIANNANQDKTTILTIERINKENKLLIEKNKTQFNKIAQQIKKETSLFKKKFNARIAALSGDDQQMGELRKDFSLLDKKYRNLEHESISQATLDKKITQLKTDLDNHMNTIDNKIITLNKNLVANILRLQKDIDQLSNISQNSNRPKPQVNIDSSESMNIEEKPLTQ